jgi:Spy/CpxP family protein refolding chaperone
MATFRSRRERLRIDLSRSRLDAREAFLEATPDRARLETIARRMGDLQGQFMRARFDMLVELKSALTAEQWSRFRLVRRPRGVIPGGVP